MDAEGNVSVLLGDPRGAIRSMAVPLFIALVVTEVNTLADRSWCSGLGQEALAAVALCSPLYLVITGLGIGMGVGGAATVSRRIGSGEIDRARVSAIQTLLFSLVFGAILAPILVLTCEDLLVLVGSGDVTQQSYDYMVWLAAGAPVLVLNGAVAGLLRGEGAARASTVMMAILAVTNIVLDPVLMYVLDMGIAGASVATVIATLVSTLVGLRVYLRSGFVGSGIRGFRYSSGDMRSVLSVGVPQMAEYTVMYAMNLVLNYIVVWCAGSDGLAVYSVPNMVVNIALLPAYAVGSALVPVAAAALGQGDRAKAEDAFRYSLRLSAVFVVVLTALLFLIPDPFLYPFTYSDGTEYMREDMALALRILSLCIPFYFLVPVSASLLQAIGRSDWSLACALARNVVFIVLYALAATVSLEWIYWAVVLGSVIGGGMLLAAARAGFGKMPLSVGTG